ncbi:MAG: TonB-dependent receptor [Gammaproteobacteria bacterium]|nr:TonB-dependent receptor [Gammaproteobacteria bacterium]
MKTKSYIQAAVRSLLIALLLTVPALATSAQSGDLEGEVVDSSGDVRFSGALVRIEELDQEVFSSADGEFKFKAIPAGEYTLSVHYIGANKVEKKVVVREDSTERVKVSVGADVGQLENIIVYGQAAGASSALNQQRAADGILSVLTSDAIGQFPDANVSEALQRVPGVFIERDQGEGRFVGIRGLEPDFNSARVNGVNIPAPERDRRSVALDVIPSDLLERIEVRKSATPDQDGDAIGGAIDIKGLSAFDRRGQHFAVTAKSDFNTHQQETSPKVNASYTNIVPLWEGDFGLAFAVSWQDRKFGSDNIETDGGWVDDIEDSGFRGTEEIEQRDYQITRKRLGYALNLDWIGDNDTHLYLRMLKSDFSDQEYRQRIEYKLDKGDLASIDSSSAHWTDIDMDRELKDRYETQDIFSLVAGGESEFEEWIVDYELGYGKASEEEPNRYDTQFSEDDAIEEAGYTSMGSTPALFYSPNGADPSNFELDELVKENNFTDDEQTTLRLDFRRDITVGGYDGYAKFGVQQRFREKNDDTNAITYDGGFPDDPTLADFIAAGSLDYDLGSLGPAIDVGSLSSYIAANKGSFEIDADNTALDSARDYNIQEDVFAIYAMHRVNIGDFRVVYGLRHESTSSEFDGFSVVEDNGDPAISPISFSKDYSHFLPSVTVRYKQSDQNIVRFGLSQSVARPSFGKINPSPDKVEIDDEDLEIEAGNAALKPYESINLDFSYEHYPDDQLSAFSVGFFAKSISSFIYVADVSDGVDFGQWTQGIDTSEVTDLDIVQPLNGDTASLWGIEASWTSRLDELAEPFNNIILSVNATFTSSEADLGPDVGRSGEIPLPGQAKFVGNAIVGYENWKWDFRLALAFKGERTLEVDLSDPENDLIQEPRTQLDFTARYDIDERWQVFVNAMNLTNQPYYTYHGSASFNGQYEEYGRSFAIGVTMRSL